MSENTQELGFIYFSSPEYFVGRKISAWMPVLRRLGASVIVFNGNFIRAIPEDIFLCAKDYQLTPVVHLTSELPLARKFNEVAFLLDVYAKWGVNEVILGNKPNMKQAWPMAGWHYDNIVDHFLDRFIPLATHAVRLGLTPVAPPLQPGGDYWDTAFMELFLAGLKRRQLSEILEHLVLSSYGHTFNKPLDWGDGGPEQWMSTEPYQAKAGQQDQLGFHHFEWMQAIGQKVSGTQFQTLILDAGNPGVQYSETQPTKVFRDIQQIMRFCQSGSPKGDHNGKASIACSDSIRFCAFSLDTLNEIMSKPFEPAHLAQLFDGKNKEKAFAAAQTDERKPIKHYLLLPAHRSGVSDAILNKVRPIIKAFQPTIGFSIREASLAERVSVYPDGGAFSDGDINQLRSSGCVVDLLPESGIEIATFLQNNPYVK